MLPTRFSRRSGKPFAAFTLDKHQAHVVEKGQRPKIPAGWAPELVEVLEAGWAQDQSARCAAGHAAGVLERLAGFAEDPLAAGPACGCALA